MFYHFRASLITLFNWDALKSFIQRVSTRDIVCCIGQLYRERVSRSFVFAIERRTVCAHTSASHSRSHCFHLFCCWCSVIARRSLSDGASSIESQIVCDAGLCSFTKRRGSSTDAFNVAARKTYTNLYVIESRNFHCVVRHTKYRLLN